MKQNTINIALAIPVILFAALALTIGLPETSVFNSSVFYYQYAITFLTIAGIPALLWFVRKDRFESESNYNKALMIRLAILEVLTIIEICSYFIIPNVAFFYLAVITYLSIFFVRK